MSEKKPQKKKHQPKGLEIIYEDRDIIVVNKANGLLTIGTHREKIHTAHNLLNEYVKKGNPRSRERVYIVHRLDKDTSGLLVFARSEKAKFFLQENWANFHKKYMAVVHGNLNKKKDNIESFLTENKVHKVYSTDDMGVGKFSKTGYKVIRESKHFSILEVFLFTGRKNQIRVHLADIGHPVVGDKVYGKNGKSFKQLALHSYSLTLVHPFTKKEMTFTTEIPRFFDSLVAPVKEKSLVQSNEGERKLVES